MAWAGLLLLAATSWAQPSAGAATRAVAHYQRLERQLAEALAQNGSPAEALPSLVAPDFSVRNAETAQVQSGPDWARQEAARTPAQRVLRDMSVHTAGGVALVSYYRPALPAQSGNPRFAAEFVVDVWSETEQTLLGRFVTRSARRAPPQSGPTGRD